MAILFGTTAEGDTLPVEVNEFGQLIAEGLTGAEGPPGPPGVGQLPADPYEGAVLGWKDGALSWLGRVVPLPKGTYGPITNYENGILTVQDEVTLPYQAEIYLSDEEGNPYSFSPVSSPIVSIAGRVLTLSNDLNLADFRVGDVVQESTDWNQTEEFSDGIVTGAPYRPWTNLFDGSLTTGVFTYTGSQTTLKLPSPVPWAYKIEVYALRYGGSLFINGSNVTASLTGIGSDPEWFDITSTVGASGVIDNLGVSDDSGNYLQLMGVRLDGKLLVDASVTDPNISVITFIDSSVPSITTDVGTWAVGEVVTGPVKSGAGTVQSASGSTIVLRTNNDEWRVGKFVTAPEQSLAYRYTKGDELRQRVE